MFSDRLQELIDINEISQKDIVDTLGFHKSQVSKWLSGGTGTPRRATLQKLSSFFGCNINWLATGEGEKYPDKPAEETGGTATLSQNKATRAVPKNRARAKHFQPRLSRHLGKRLQFLLDLRGVNPKQAAKEIGITEDKFNFMLDGNMIEREIITLQKTARFFKCKIDWLLNGDIPEQSPGKLKIAAKIEPGNGNQNGKMRKNKDQYPTVPEPPLIEENTPQADQEEWSLKDMVDMTIMVLESKTVYRSALASNVRAFYQAVQNEAEMNSITQKLESMEMKDKERDARMERMEKMLITLGQAVTPQKRDAANE